MLYTAAVTILFFPHRSSYYTVVQRVAMNKYVSKIYSFWCIYLYITGQAMVSDPRHDGVNLDDPTYAHIQPVLYCGIPEL